MGGPQGPPFCRPATAPLNCLIFNIVIVSRRRQRYIESLITGTCDIFLNQRDRSVIVRIFPLPASSAIIAAAAMLAGAPAANAALTTYTSQAGYLAAVGTTGVDTFDDLDIEPYDTPLPRTAGDYSYIATTGPGNPRAYGASNDDIDWWLSSSRATDAITFSGFGPGIAGAGGYFFGSDIAGFSVLATSITLTATDSSGATLVYTIDAPVLTSFVGFVSDVDITSLSVQVLGQPGVWPTVNDFHLSAPVPEPATCGMLLGGLGLLGYAARRRQRQA